MEYLREGRRGKIEGIYEGGKEGDEKGKEGEEK